MTKATSGIKGLFIYTVLEEYESTTIIAGNHGSEHSHSGRDGWEHKQEREREGTQYVMTLLNIKACPGDFLQQGHTSQVFLNSHPLGTKYSNAQTVENISFKPPHSMPSVQRHNVTLSGLGQPYPCGPDTYSTHGLSLWPVPLSACSFSWQMFHIWYLQHPEVSSTIRLHLHGIPHCLLRGCLQEIWPCMVHIALFQRLMQSFMTPIIACLQSQHRVDSTKFCWEVVRLSFYHDHSGWFSLQ